MQDVRDYLESKLKDLEREKAETLAALESVKVSRNIRPDTNPSLTQRAVTYILSVPRPVKTLEICKALGLGKKMYGNVYSALYRTEQVRRSSPGTWAIPNGNS